MLANLARTTYRHGGILAAMLSVLAVLVLLPGLGFVSLLGSRFWNDVTLLSAMQGYAIRETGVLLGGIALMTGGIGLGTAWLVSMHDFPGRRMLRIALILPLAFPTYLAAFIAVDLMHYFGPLQTALRWLTGAKSARDYWFPDMRSMGGAVIVLSLVLFPYVYVPCTILFSRTGRNVIDAARMLGASGFELFWRIGVPLARPALFAGTTLALLEALNDIGATEYLGISSLSVLIRDLWANRGDLPGAMRIALMLLAMVFLLLVIERSATRHTRRDEAGRTGRARPALIVLSGVRGWLACAACMLPVLLGFVLPAAFLVMRVLGYSLASSIDASFFTAALTTFGLAAIVSIAVMIAGALVVIAIRMMPALGRASLFTTIGYATPGTVLALAVLPVIRVSDDLLVNIGVDVALTATSSVVIYALCARFLGIGTAQAGISLAKLPKNVDHVARVHGMHDLELGLRVHLPVILPGLMLGGILVFIDTVKELPATLLLRPLNFDTLATRAYALASSGQFEQASLDALMIVVMSAIAAYLVVRRT